MYWFLVYPTMPIFASSARCDCLLVCEICLKSLISCSFLNMDKQKTKKFLLTGLTAWDWSSGSSLENWGRIFRKL